jgi:hypothetical protein
MNHRRKKFLILGSGPYITKLLMAVIYKIVLKSSACKLQGEERRGEERRGEER